MVRSYSNSEHIDLAELFGLTSAHLVPIESGKMLIHPKSITAWLDMQAAARLDGIEIQPASAFRGFDRQLEIWNAKAEGRRKCLDDQGNCIDLSQLSELDAVLSIMRFSALPGASRHHWGTDLDIFDANAVAPDYVLQLVESEYAEGGPFHKLSNWLEDRAERFGFARPYVIDRGGVAVEPWHISHTAVAKGYSRALNPDLLAAQLGGADLSFKSAVLDNLQSLFERFIQIT